MEEKTYEVDKVAFDSSKQKYRGYWVRASYLIKPHSGDSLIEIFKEDKMVRRFIFPAYKIYNIGAHFSDIVDSEIDKNTNGYEMAAWDGLSGATVIF